MASLADMPEVLTIEETASLLRIGRTSAYQAARAGELPVIRLGRKLLVPRRGLEVLLGANNDHDPDANGAVSQKGDREDAASRANPCNEA